MLAGPGVRAQDTDDPLGSPRWEEMRQTFFPGAEVVFDDRVRVSAPTTAEDALNVPVAVDLRRLQAVEEVVVFADFNPIVRALSYEPGGAHPGLAFRLKLQQSTPVRAAARTADGRWHVGGTWVNTTGGGCTLPSTGAGSPEWQQRLNQVSARLWPRVDGGTRLRLQVVHPMDTGLAAGIPVFHIETLDISNADGERLMRIRPAEPVAENPLFTIDIPPAAVGGGSLRISGRDNNGNPIMAEVAP
ncbi:quinoprotein dehydrogenase-associated SoxYZ-like carrier [Thauera linaloolentis]|nr:quinoprotein dehydrogenase-associated SoxYZ-like carrier [Thauera linaloolentis]MCM8567375.1 quinoprotein dehydrogenase-associated SoxYZ-like carrier [Thauera linaloolentis]